MTVSPHIALKKSTAKFGRSSGYFFFIATIV